MLRNPRAGGGWQLRASFRDLRPPGPSGSTGLPARCAGVSVYVGRLWDFESLCLKSGPEVRWVASLSSEAAGLQSEFLKPSASGTPSFGKVRRKRLELCRAYTLQGLRFLRYGCVISADCDEPDGLVSVAGYNPAASTTSPKSLPPARPARAKVVGAVPLFADCARAGVTDISRSILFPSGSCRAYRLACSTFPGIRRHG